MKLLNYLTALVLLVCSAACSDNKHEEPKIPADVTYTGTLMSKIPAFPTFEGVENENMKAMVKWQDVDATMSTIVLDAFDITIANMGNMTIKIGSMTISDVAWSYDNSGNAKLTQSAFTCIAGDYEVKGSLTGTYNAAQGLLTFTLNYQPGSMPYEVVSTYTGKK